MLFQWNVYFSKLCCLLAIACSRIGNGRIEKTIRGSWYQDWAREAKANVSCWDYFRGRICPYNSVDGIENLGVNRWKSSTQRRSLKLPYLLGSFK